MELFVGPVVEPWDLGMVPRPKNPPLRMLSMHKMDERADNDAPPDPELTRKMAALIEEMTAEDERDRGPPNALRT